MPDWDVLDPHVRQLIAEGLTDTEIAQRLGLKRQTLVDHLRKQRMRDQGAPPRAAAEERPGQVGLDDADTPADAVSGITDISPVIMSGPLSADEAHILAHYEEII